ncbi:hypothetical protein [Bacillus taeanensis]|uniref:hypothetical protein n=1 Tax=Bacillus taeanensis TaxID=273032 RepID=UPI0015F0BA9B|nr:hypothetical protein [Bacillus taeanensis]
MDKNIKIIALVVVLTLAIFSSFDFSPQNSSDCLETDLTCTNDREQFIEKINNWIPNLP